MHDAVTPGALRAFPHDRPEHPVLGYRERGALEQLVRGEVSWRTLSAHERLASALGARDLYFEARTDERLVALAREVAQCVPRQGELTVHSLSASFHPTSRFMLLRFVEASALPPAWRPFFARPIAQMPHLAAVFVDPEEFHFRTFENIIPLDRHLERFDLTLALTKREGATSEDGPVALFAVDGAHEALATLDALDLYVTPLNASSRGGLRYIFHSAALAAALTEAAREALPEELLEGFSHVNPVFRCNRFSPSDRPFSSHHDSPYRDPARGHTSRHTLLLYITGGRGAPALRVEGTSLDEIAPMTCAIFDQRHEHEGAPFDEGDKVFLRTELVFEGLELEDEPALGQLFTRACYLTGESIFRPELARYADDYYDRVARAHWYGLSEHNGGELEPFLCKAYRDVHFVTNGHDYWFLAEGLELEECAALAILDHFNCKVYGEAFRKRCETTLEERPDAAWIAPHLEARSAPTERALGRVDLELLFPPPERVDPDIEVPERIVLEFGSAWSDYGDMSRQRDILDVYEAAQRDNREVVSAAPILMMGQELFLSREHFLIEGDRIHVMSRTPVAPLNFAAMTYAYFEPEDFVEAEVEMKALHMLLPPILFRREDRCYHLMLDFFRNTWMVNLQPRYAEAPRITC